MADNNLLEDNVILGILAGLIGNIPKELIMGLSFLQDI